MHRFTLPLSALFVLLLTVFASGQTVKVNWQNQAPFSDYRTYAWKESKNQGAHFYRQWVQKDVDTELGQRGLQKVTAGQNPDVYIYYHIVGQEVTDSTTTDDGFGWGGGSWGFSGGWGGWGEEGMGGMGGVGMDMSQTEAEPRMMGILSVDIVDAKKKHLVWRGQATTDAISNSQKGDEKQVLKSIDKMFKQFPPNEKK
ncbi:MAG: DUF4136 domain-containing protein [Candidatus Sulfotelmatobacter sp.]